MEQGDTQMEKIVSLAKKRGFIFQGNELYGGLAGIYDYGPLGSLLKYNVKELWLKQFVFSREDTYLLDAALLMGENALTASGHVGGFSDPLIVDMKTGKEYRLDHILEDAGIENADELRFEEMCKLVEEKGILSPDGNPLGNPREFNLMFKTQLGSSSDSSSTAYLRPETAQGIFVNYKNVMDSMHPKIPFGIAQIGKAFRNEITPRNFIFRLREFEQMEMEYFIHERDWEKYFEYWREQMHEWFRRVGFDESRIHEKEVTGADLAHYSKRTIDFEFDYPFGRKELYGLAYRTNYDLSKHSEHSKTKLQYTDPYTNETFIPHVIEPSLGLERTILALLLSAYREDTLGNGTRVYLAFKPEIAPYKIAVFPLVRNKEHIVAKAREVYSSLKEQFGNVVWDDNGNIGKRYRRQDEIGTPFTIVVDYETLEGDETQRDTVTVRDRDTGEQERVAIGDLSSFLKEKLRA